VGNGQTAGLTKIPAVFLLPGEEEQMKRAAAGVWVVGTGIALGIAHFGHNEALGAAWLVGAMIVFAILGALA
jgi:hypothetical protein